MLPLLHAGWRRGRAVASGLRHPYQVRRLRSVFGSGRACRNSWDFRTAVISATPAPGAKPSAAPGPAPGAAPGRGRSGAWRGACCGAGAAQAAEDSRPVTRGTHHRATPVCTVPARPRLLLLSHAPSHASVACLCRITAIAAAPPPHPPYITPSPQTPPFSHIIPYPPPPTSPRPPPESPPPRSGPPPGIPARPRIRPAPAPRAALASGLRSRHAPDPGAGPCGTP
jgi:hypothetical protein